MKFFEAIDATLIDDIPVRRKCWHEDNYMWLAEDGVWECNFERAPYFIRSNDCLGLDEGDHETWAYILHENDVLASDWEVLH